MDIQKSVQKVVFIISLIIASSNSNDHDYYYKNYIHDSYQTQGSALPFSPLPTVNPPENWEVGLREAVYRALTRNRVADPPLKKSLKAAPITNRNHNGVSRFGDIAVIARGQLFARRTGYEFKQDPYPTDCDDCFETKRCYVQKLCSFLKDSDEDSLVALWSIKRIRHRDPIYGQRYEFHYIITPKKDAKISLIKHRKPDYTVPGHLFIVKTQPNDGQKIYNVGSESKRIQNRREYSYIDQAPISSHKGSYWVHRDLNIGEIYNPKNNPLTPYSPIGNDYDTFKLHPIHFEENRKGSGHDRYRPVVHNIPELIPNLQLQPPLGQSIENDENPFIQHFHHHYYVSDIKSTNIPSFNEYRNHPKVLLKTTRPQNYYGVTEPLEAVIKQADDHPTSEKYTFKQLYNSDEQIVTTDPQHIFQKIKPSVQTDPINNYRLTEKPFLIPTQYQVSQPPHSQTSSLIPNTKVSVTYPTKSTTFRASPMFVQYSQPDPSYPNTLNPTVPTEFVTLSNSGQIIPTTIFQLHPTAPTYYNLIPTTNSQIENTDDYKIDTSHRSPKLKYRTRFENHSEKKYPDSINAQLPPPDKGTDTTVPYVASTLITQTTPTETTPIVREQIFKKIPTNKTSFSLPKKTTVPTTKFSKIKEKKYQSKTTTTTSTTTTSTTTTTTSTTTTTPSPSPEYSRRKYNEKKGPLRTTVTNKPTRAPETKPIATIRELPKRKYINSNFKPILRTTTSTTTETPREKYSKAIPKYRSKIFTGRFNKPKLTTEISVKKHQNTTKPKFTSGSIEYFDSKKIGNGTSADNSFTNHETGQSTTNFDFNKNSTDVTSVQRDDTTTTVREKETTTGISAQESQEHDFITPDSETNSDTDFSEISTDNLPYTSSQVNNIESENIPKNHFGFRRNDTSTLQTLTKQSYSTSVSFRVGNQKPNKTSTIEDDDVNEESHSDITNATAEKQQYPIKANIYEIHKNNSEFNIFRAELPSDNHDGVDVGVQNDTILFDDIALLLVNHAKGVTYSSHNNSTFL